MSRGSTVPYPLKKAPAVEVVYGLQSITPDDLVPAEVAERVKNSLPEGFTIQQPVDHVNIAFKREGGGALEHSQTQTWTGLRLIDADGRTAAHLLRAGLFVNFLNYTDYDHALPLVKSMWQVYQDAFKPLHVQRLSIRYINILKLPFEDDKVPLGKYFHVHLTFPESLSGNMQHFHYQFLFTEDGTGMPARIMLSSVKEEDNELHVAFDNEGYLEGQLQPTEERIWTDLGEIRNWTYHIFCSILTEECAELFTK